MFENIINYVFKKRAQKHLKNQIRNKQFVNYDKAKSILLLFESNYSEKNVETKKIIQYLLKDGKRVTAWGFVDKKQIISAAYPEYRILHPKDLDIFKRPKSQLLQELLQNEYDLIIDISNRRIFPLDYLVLYANAKCKTGMKKCNLNLYDFAVDIENHLIANEIEVEDLEFSFLFKQILFYLKNIQTND